MAAPSHTPARPYSTYQAFMSKLNDPQASSLLRSMKVFVRNALAATEKQPRTLSIDELAEAIQAFFIQTEIDIAAHPLWADCDSLELERACDSVEKFVMNKLYDRVFSTEADEVAEDEQLSLWLRRLGFLTIDHFAISSEFQAHAPWTSAQEELRKISTYRTPRDKLVCILNCCKRINSALSHSSSGGHGADEFFPVLLYVTLHAAPPGLHASLQYITRFRHPSKLISESAYYLTHMQSAIAFLSNVQPEQLTIDSAAFERGLAETHAAIEQERAAAAAAAAEAARSAAAAVAEAEAAAAATRAAAEVDTLMKGPPAQNGTPPRKMRALVDGSLALCPETPQVVEGVESLQPSLVNDLSAASAEQAPSAVLSRGAVDQAVVGERADRHSMAAGVDESPVGSNSRSALSLEMRVVEDCEGVGFCVRISLSSCTELEHCRRKLIRELGPPPSLRYIDVRSVNELKLGDVEAILEGYKWLSRAFRTAAKLRGEK